MRWKPIGRVALLGVPVVALGACAGVRTAAAPIADYMGQSEPTEGPEVFGAGVVSTAEAVELNGVFAPGFVEFFFARTQVRPGGGEGVSRMYRCVRGPGGDWSSPEAVQVWPDGATSLSVDMSYSPDGNRLYFLGQHAHERSPVDPGFDIWMIERTERGGWSLARPVAPPVWSEYRESYPAVMPDGGLQFSSDRPGGFGKTDLWRAAPLPGGGFAEPVNMGPQINSEHGEGDSCVAPDGSYIVFTSRRPGGPGNGDLYVSFRGAAVGEWSEPVLLGHGVNTQDTDYCPMVTPDGRYLFFSRRISEPKDAGWDGVVAGDVYWISTSVIEELRP